MTGNRPHVWTLSQTADVNESAANTETVAATIANITSEFPNSTVTIDAFLAITAGTTATSMTLRIRRDSLTGTIVGEAVADAGDIAASKLSSFPIRFDDVRAGDFSGSYVVTFQGAGEGTAAVCNSAHITAIVS